MGIFYAGIYLTLPLPVWYIYLYLPVSMNNSIVLLLCNFESTVVDTTINKVGTVDSKIETKKKWTNSSNHGWFIHVYILNHL